jgi:hypothetical protein
MKKTHFDPITSDFSPGSLVDSGKPPTAKVALIIAAIILTALAAFFAVVHYWR